MAIHIPEPCTEDWSKMTPTEQGAYCQKCALEVVDFTRKSPVEIKTILVQQFAASERVCGHIRQSQMDVINEVGFDWTNERERFQSVWIVSMLAIFGLTLFSCQTNVSRELVEKMNQEGQEIVAAHEGIWSDQESDILVEETALEKAPDTAANYSPWKDIVATSGAIPWSPEIDEWMTCTAFMGDIAIVNGSITTEPAKDDQAIAQFFWNNLGGNSKQFQYPEIVTPLPEQGNSGPRSELIYDEDLDDFVGYITPVPLSEQSRLIVEVFREIELHLRIEDTVEETTLFSDSYTTGKSVLTIDPHFSKFRPGNYKIYLKSDRTQQTIRFSTLE